MSIQDKIRDSLYGSLEDERKDEDEALALADLDRSFDTPFVAQKRLLIFSLVEIVLVAFQLFAPRSGLNILNWSGDAFILALAAPFVVGFLIAFSAYKSWRSFRPKNVAIDTADLPILEYPTDLDQVTIWFVAGLGGILNTILLFFLRGSI